MISKSEKLIRYQIRFGWGLFVSSAFVLLSYGGVFLYYIYLYRPPSGVSLLTVVPLLPFIALLVFMVPFMGFIFTSVLSLRRESRDRKTSKLGDEKTSLEIQLLKIKIAKAQKEISVLKHPEGHQS